MVDSTVRVDPFHDVGYDKTVSITIDTGAVKDLFGDTQRGNHVYESTKIS